jgi:hypothetical protein
MGSAAEAADVLLAATSMIFDMGDRVMSFEF